MVLRFVTFKVEYEYIERDEVTKCVKYFNNDTDAINFLERIEQKYGENYLRGTITDVGNGRVFAVNGDYILKY